MADRPDTDLLVREALVLRRFACAVLGGAQPATLDRALDTARTCGRTGWALFLHTESCTLPLARRLRQSGLWTALPEDVRGLIEQAEFAEIQRVLAAQAQLTTIDVVAARLALAPVVLKGGAHLATHGEPLDLGDVDVLVPNGGAPALDDALRAAFGMAAAAAPDDPDSALQSHLPGIEPPGGIKIEVHRRIEYGGVPYHGAGACPLPGFRMLRHAPTAEMLVHLLRHIVVQHPHRRGHLRDLLLFAHMLRGFEAAEHDRLNALVDSALEGPEFRALLVQARAIDGGAPVPDSHDVQLVAARKYELFIDGLDARAVFVPLWAVLAFVGFERHALAQTRLRDYVDGGWLSTSSRYYWAGLRRLSPTLPDRVGRTMRAAYRLLASGVAVGVSARARRRAARRIARLDQR